MTVSKEILYICWWDGLGSSPLEFFRHFNIICERQKVSNLIKRSSSFSICGGIKQINIEFLSLEIYVHGLNFIKGTN